MDWAGGCLRADRFSVLGDHCVESDNDREVVEEGILEPEEEIRQEGAPDHPVTATGHRRRNVSGPNMKGRVARCSGAGAASWFSR